MEEYAKFRCETCQHEFEQDAHTTECICPRCGQQCKNVSQPTSVNDNLTKCQECGNTLPAGVKACPMCGCPADDNEPTAATNEKCEECGIALPAGATACPNCGCPVSAGKAAMQGAAPPPPNYSAIQPEKKKSNKQTIIIIAIVAAVILLGGIGAFIALNGNSSEQPSSVTEEYDYVETPVEVEIAEPVVTQKFVVVNGTNVRLRYAPSFDSDWLKWYDGTIRCADKGDELPYVSETNEWYGVIYQNGNYYIHKDFSYVVER